MKYSTLISSLLAFALNACGGSGKTAASPDSSGGEDGGEVSGVCSALEECDTMCSDGNAEACEWLGRMYETGEGAPQDYEKAAKAYDAACSGGSDESCAHLAMMYDIGLAVEEDPNRAAELYRKACASGNRWACNRGEQLEQ